MRTAAYFLGLGHYDALIRRTRNEFAKRRDVMQTAIANFGLQIASHETHGGSSFWMQAPRGVDTEQLAYRLMEKNVLIEPGRAFFHGRTRPREFYRLAYSSINTSRIPEGIELIADAIRAG